MTKKPQRRADGGPVTRVVDPPRPAKVRDVDRMADDYRKSAPPRYSRFPSPDSSKSDLNGLLKPPPTRDAGEYDYWPVKDLNPKPSQVSMAKGGKVTKVMPIPKAKRRVFTPDLYQGKDKYPAPTKDDKASRGGKITRVAGNPVGKEDGLIAVQKGEFVVRRAAVQKHGPKKMAAVNAGTARITVPKGVKRK